MAEDEWDRGREAAYRRQGEQQNGPRPEPGSNRNYGPQGKSRRRRSRAFDRFLTSAEFMALMKPPDYLTDGLLLRGATYTLTGLTGHCKTLIALLLAIRVASGDWFCGRKCKQGTVAFFAGENPENVMMQFHSMCADLDVDPRALKIIWHPGVFDLEEARAKTRASLADYPDLALCIFDSLQAFFTGEDDSHNMQMLDLAIDFRSMADGHPNRPTGIILAHPIKNATRDNLLPRGGSSLTNELDGNLTVWLEEEKGIATLHWLGKYRGIPFDPIKLEKIVIKPEGLVDAEGNQMPCTIVRQLGPSREAELATANNNREIAVLRAYEADPSISQTALATMTGITRSTVQRTIKELQGKKLIRDYSGNFKLTKEGKTALELATKRPAEGG